MSGVGLSGKIVPLNGGSFPVFEDINGDGGLRTVADIASRNAVSAIPAFCKEGMLVYVQSTQCYYELGANLTTWTIVANNGLLGAQATWFIDSTAGSDSNTGATSLTALATWSEFQARVNPNGEDLNLTTNVVVTIVNTTGVIFEASIRVNTTAAQGQIATCTLTVKGSVTSSAAMVVSAFNRATAPTTRSQITVSSGALTAKQRIRITVGANAGGMAYSTGQNANAQNHFLSLFCKPAFTGLANAADPAVGDSIVSDTLNTTIANIEVTSLGFTRVIIQDLVIRHAATFGNSNLSAFTEGGGNVMFAGCDMANTNGRWVGGSWGSILAACRQVAASNASIFGFEWLIVGCVFQGAKITMSSGSAAAYGFCIDGGHLYLGMDGDLNHPDNGGPFKLYVNGIVPSGPGAVEVENGDSGTAITISFGSVLSTDVSNNAYIWGASTAYAIGFNVGGWIFISNFTTTVLADCLAIPSTTNLQVAGLPFSYSNNPCVFPNLNCGVACLKVPGFSGAAQDGIARLTAQSANIAATALINPSFAGLYNFEAYLACTTVDAASVGAPVLNAVFIDDSGVSRTVPIASLASLTALGGVGGSAIIESNSAAIQYSITGITSAGAARFSVRVRCTMDSAGP